MRAQTSRPKITALAEVGQIENTDEVLTTVKAEHESLVTLEDTKEQLRDVDANFFSIAIKKKKAPVEQAINQDAEIRFLQT